MKLRPLISLLFLAAHSAYAFDPFVVQDIRVEGIQRTEAGTVFSYLPIRVGETMTKEKASTAIKALFETGFFRDVQIEAEGTVLVVSVHERPAIASIQFSGLSDLPEEDLRKALKSAGLSEGRILDPAVLERAEVELKNQYLSRGRYGVKIETIQTPLERNRVSIHFAVDEGLVAKIRQITFIGNKSFSDSKLSGVLDLGTSNWISWYTKRDRYSKEKLAADLEKLRSFYQNQGYLEFSIESTQVSISPDKTEIYITIIIDEGQVFKVGNIEIAGQLGADPTAIKKQVTLKAGQTFSREKLNETTTALSDLLGQQGFAFANVSAIPEVNRENRTVDIRIMVDPGRRVYVRKINIKGNTQTKDEVIRREFRQFEGAWYDSKKIARSKERVERLSYFESVEIEMTPVPGIPDQVDLELTVKEMPLGKIQLGMGLSSSDKMVLSGTLSQDNLLGTGNTFALNVSTSKANENYSLSFTNPYYTVDGISRGFDIYHRTFDATQYDDVADYKTKTTGAGIRFGIPISEDNAIHIGLSYEVTNLTLYPESPKYFRDFMKHYGSSPSALLLKAAWNSDTRDSVLYPTKGISQRLSINLGLPGATTQYYKVHYEYRHYIPMTDYFTLLYGGQAGIGDGYGGKPLPFYDNFYAGGIGSVRGYSSSSLGPRDEEGYAMGGDRIVTGTVEVMWPMPGMEKSKSARLSTFFDIGQVFGSGEKFSTSGFRYSAGIGLFWLSPMGPMRFSYGYPLNRKDGDSIERLQFTFGTTF